MGLWAAYMALCELPSDATGVLYIENKYVLDGLTRLRKGWARRRWRKPTGQPILNGAMWRILSAAADARPGIRMAKAEAEGGDACVTLAYRRARTEAGKVRAGSKPVGGSGTILDDCAEEDAAENLAWMCEGEAEGEAA
jgi:ribonuclease HI